MPALAVIGAQWGDEAKGKIVHFLARKAEVCVRFNGGPNAGHTVVDEHGEVSLHQIPAGALHPQCLGILAHGMVLDLWALEEELAALGRQGRPQPKLLISDRAHLIFPWHRQREEQEGLAQRLGTTKKGIGPAYADRAARRGLRVMDLSRPDHLAKRLCAEGASSILPDLSRLREKFAPFLGDARAVLAEALQAGKAVVFEGAQGTLLDVDLGTYPYVTSSHTTVHGIPWGTGVWPTLAVVLGVAKAYTTRVGAGPLPTEDLGPAGQRLREVGREYGATTGRPRRCGWLDLVALRYAHTVNSFTHLALTKLDVLSGFPELKVAVAYRLAGKRWETFPPFAEDLFQAEPVYETLPGWHKEITGIREFSHLPKEAQQYIRFVEEGLGVPVALVGTGSRAEDVIVRAELLGYT